MPNQTNVGIITELELPLVLVHTARGYLDSATPGSLTARDDRGRGSFHVRFRVESFWMLCYVYRDDELNVYIHTHIYTYIHSKTFTICAENRA
jgi:hypothetical protein